MRIVGLFVALLYAGAAMPAAGQGGASPAQVRAWVDAPPASVAR